MTTFAPRAANMRADAAPMPDAPPVTIALAPEISMDLKLFRQSRMPTILG